MRKFRMYLITNNTTERSVSYPDEYTEEQVFDILDGVKDMSLSYEIREVIQDEKVVKPERKLV